MYDTILLPTDGSDHARRAAEHGRYLAAAFDATVHVLGVVDLQRAAGPFNLGGVDEEFVDRLEDRRWTDVEDVAALIDEATPVATAVVQGDPGETILSYAADHGVDLIAMGTHGRTGVERYISGSVCEHVVRNAPVPVLTARAPDASDPTVAYDDVLVPTDGSTAATVAVDHAVAIAAAVDARVHAVSVVDLGDVAASSEFTVPGDLMDVLEERGQEAVDSIAESAEDAGCEAVTAVIGGFPADDLLTYADEQGIDLIAMGTAGRNGLDRFLLGSTTERVLRHADVPVVSVNAGELAEEG